LSVAIEDDGRGVDFGRVADVAAKQGLISDADAAHKSHDALARILFKPGFSTSRVVTALSGRGMGLSVVYEAVRRMQGEAHIQPRNGGGAVLHLSVPLSISTHRLLVVKCSGQNFAFPIHAIERLRRIKPQTIETMEGKPVVNLDGER